MALNFSAFKKKIDEEEQERGRKPAELDFSSFERPKFLEEEKGSLFGNVAKGVGSAIKSFVGNQASNIKALATGEVKLRDVLNEVPSSTVSVGKGALDITKELIQSPLRFATRTGLSTVEAVTGKKQDFNFQSETAKAFFGADSIDTFQTQTQQGREIIESLGGKKTTQDTLPIGVILVGGLLDFTGTGSSKNVVKKLTKEGSEEVVEQILKKEAKGLTDDFAKKIAPKIAKETDEKAVQEIIEKAFRDQADAPVKKSLKAPDFNTQDDFLRSIDDLPNKDDFVSRRTKELFDDSALKKATKEIGERRSKARILAEQEFELLEQGFKRAKATPTRAFKVSTDPVQSSKSALSAIENRGKETVEGILKKNTEVLNILKKEIDQVKNADEFAERLLKESFSDVKKAIDNVDPLTKQVDELVAGLQKRADQITKIARDFDSGKAKISKAQQDKLQKEFSSIKSALQQLGSENQSTIPKIRGSRASDILLGDTGSDTATAKAKLVDLYEAITKKAETPQATKKTNASQVSKQVSPSKNIQKNVDAVVSLDEKKVKIDPKEIIPKTGKDSPVINVQPKTVFGKKFKALKETAPILKVQEAVQDSWIRVKRVMEKEGVKFTDDSNPYQEQQLFHGIVGAMEEDLEKQLRGLDTQIRKMVKKTKVDDAVFRKDVNDFLYARHALERNKALGNGASGITDDVARETLERVDGSVASKEVKEVAEQLQKINDETLDILLDGEVISKELYDSLRKKYKTHVPLNRVLPEDSSDEMVQVLGTKGFNVSGVKPIRVAKGSDLPVRDIQANIVANYKQALERAQKNKVNISTYKFAKENDMLGGMFKEVTEGGNKLDVISFRLKGEQKYLRVNDIHLAKAFQDLNKTQLDAFTRAFATITRFYSGLATRFNPEFVISNIIRDTQDLFINMIGISGKAKNAGRAVTRVPKSTIDILDWIRNKDSAGAKLYQQMRLDGGTTGGLSFTTREGIEKEIDDIVKNGGKITHKTWRKLVKGIEDYNRVFEDATRLSAYKEALESGYTRKQSATIAKNATVNFNTRGTASPWINAWYMFANASVQGSIRTIRSMKNPKVLGTMVATIGGGVYWTHNHNDSIDPDWREKIRPYDRNHNFVILLPTEKTFNGELQYMTIPVSWGLKPIKVLMERSYEMSQGVDTGNIVGDTASAFLEAYNPVGGTDFMSTIIPTPFDVPVEVARNKAWHGGMIFPDWKKGLPASEQIFDSTAESLSGQTAIQVSELLDKVNIEVSPEVLEYGFDQLVGGAGRSAQRAIDTTTGILSGEVDEIEKSDLIYVNRFLKELKPTEVERRLEKKGETELLGNLKDEKDLVERKDLIRDYVRGLEKEDAQSILFKLREQGFDTKGVSYSENPRKPSAKEGTFDEWYAYYRSRKFNYTREEAKEMAEGWVGTVENAEGSTNDKDAKLKAIFGDLGGEKPKTDEDKQKTLESIFDFSE